MKECVACAEEIKSNAKLCKHCGTLQDDERFTSPEPGEAREYRWDSENYLEQIASQKRGQELFASLSRSKKILSDLAGSNDPSVKACIGSNENAPAELLEALSQDQDTMVRCAIASNPHAPLEILVRLSKDADDLVRASAASNPNIPIDVLSGLFHENTDEVQESLATNWRLPIRLIENLSHHEDDFVRGGVGENPSTPETVLRKLAIQPANVVRSGVAKNPNAPQDLLESLACDKYEEVRRSVACNTSATPNVLADLANSSDYFTRSAVGSNRNTSIQTLERLSRDSEEFVREGVAKNPKTPELVLRGLCSDQSELVRWEVVANEALPLRDFESLLIDLGSGHEQSDQIGLVDYLLTTELNTLVLAGFNDQPTQEIIDLVSMDIRPIRFDSRWQRDFPPAEWSQENRAVQTFHLKNMRFDAQSLSDLSKTVSGLMGQQIRIEEHVSLIQDEALQTIVVIECTQKFTWSIHAGKNLTLEQMQDDTFDYWADWNDSPEDGVYILATHQGHRPGASAQLKRAQAVSDTPKKLRVRVTGSSSWSTDVRVSGREDARDLAVQELGMSVVRFEAGADVSDLEAYEWDIVKVDTVRASGKLRLGPTRDFEVEGSNEFYVDFEFEQADASEAELWAVDEFRSSWRIRNDYLNELLFFDEVYVEIMD